MAATAHHPKTTPTIPASLRKKWAAWGQAGQDAFDLVMEARKGLPAAMAFEVAEAFQLQANELDAIYELSTKTLRTYTQGKKTASSGALACLENVVHRGGEGLNDQFRVLEIDVPDDLLVEEIALGQSPPHWEKASRYAVCQPLGAAWYTGRNSAVLRVPSSIIPQESNYILHTRHPEFKRIQIVGREAFSFDARIKTEKPE